MNVDIIQRLRNHVAQMAPHHREREQGRLIVDALAEIERLTASRPLQLNQVLKSMNATLIASNGIVWIADGYEPVCFGTVT